MAEGTEEWSLIQAGEIYGGELLSWLLVMQKHLVMRQAGRRML